MKVFDKDNYSTVAMLIMNPVEKKGEEIIVKGNRAHSHVGGGNPYVVVLKNEHPTSNIERPTSNKKQTPNYRTFNSYFCFFIFSHSTFNVQRSMFISKF
ncbi:MAG: hypothetical protein C4B58_16280 [Deltaproteobacteria bacterium]|nr:MAG: hypothetical protein C4B58_16280 [Deltaproteobacteria bacterium]